MGADDRMGTDVIEFRLRGGGINERVVVTINGVELSDLWARAKQQPTDPLPTAEVGMGLARPGVHTASCRLAQRHTRCPMGTYRC
jgi:hypothetical protein